MKISFDPYRWHYGAATYIGAAIGVVAAVATSNPASAFYFSSIVAECIGPAIGGIFIGAAIAALPIAIRSRLASIRRRDKLSYLPAFLSRSWQEIFSQLPFLASLSL